MCGSKLLVRTRLTPSTPEPQELASIVNRLSTIAAADTSRAATVQADATAFTATSTEAFAGITSAATQGAAATSSKAETATAEVAAALQGITEQLSATAAGLQQLMAYVADNAAQASTSRRQFVASHTAAVSELGEAVAEKVREAAFTIDSQRQAMDAYAERAKADRANASTELMASIQSLVRGHAVFP